MTIYDYEGYVDKDDVESITDVAIDPEWELQQKKTFTAWCNAHLRNVNEQINVIENDFQDGLKLMKLLEVISGEQLPKPDRGKMRFHKIANVNKALDFIESKGVKLVSIGAEEIVDGNVKMTLGMIWTIILRFAIQDIQIEDSSAKEGLLLWCQRQTAPYKNVRVENFHTSFKDGLAFCAIIHRNRPQIINYSQLSARDPIKNLNLAFDVAEKHLDIPKMLDPEDMVSSKKCDERSVMAYLSSYYHVFSGSHKMNIAATRITNNLRMIRENQSLKECYETISTSLLSWIKMKLEEFEEWLLEELQRLERLEYLAKKFDVKCSTHEAWTMGKPEALASNDFRSATLSEMRALQKKHEAFQSDMTAHHARIEHIQALTEELNKLNHFNINVFNQRYNSIITTWDEMKKLSSQREREISKALTALEEIDQLHLDFAKRAAPFNNWMEQTEEDLRDTFIVHTMPEVEKLIAAHETFENTLDEAENESRQLQLCAQKVGEIADEYKLVNATQNPYTNIKPHELPLRWNMIRELTQKRSALLHSERERQLANDRLRREFAQKAEAFNSSIETHRAEIVKITMESRCSLEDQRNYLQKLEEELNKHQDKLNELEHANQALEDAYVFENPYTVYSMPTLRVAWEQLFTLLHYSVNEIDNQILTRDSKGLTAEQMDDLRTSFKHFDKNNTRRLEPNEFKACLVSLGYKFRDDIKSSLSNLTSGSRGSVCAETDFSRIINEVDPGHTGYISFDAFLNFMTRDNVDEATEEQLIQSFKTMGGDKGYITAQDIKEHLSADDANYCLKNMSVLNGPTENRGALDFESFVYSICGHKSS
ncbi:Alpha-actinin [Schistosoma japonicum]|nr:Alpha-actinin [Schistosoma japonicum]